PRRGRWQREAWSPSGGGVGLRLQCWISLAGLPPPRPRHGRSLTPSNRSPRNEITRVGNEVSGFAGNVRSQTPQIQLAPHRFGRRAESARASPPAIGEIIGQESLPFGPDVLWHDIAIAALFLHLPRHAERHGHADRVIADRQHLGLG